MLKFITPAIRYPAKRFANFNRVGGIEPRLKHLAYFVLTWNRELSLEWSGQYRGQPIEDRSPH